MGFAVLFLSIFTFVELNCENLFDCRHDSLKQDVEFTPEGSRRWTPSKYWRKLDNLSKAITACGMDGTHWRLPDMVALCEVENDSVMRDLTRRSPLRGLRYEYAVTDSPDARGIDVALLWHPGSFAMISSSSLRMEQKDGIKPTRDILYVCGRIVTGDTLHVFVVHAPSRYGGVKRTQPQRMAVAGRLAAAIDSLRKVCAEPKIIVAGDFNDTSDSPALKYLYGKGLENVSAQASGTHGAKASYKYKGEWQGIDQILLSRGIAPWAVSCFVNDMPFLLEDDVRYGGCKPMRTSNGYRYQNGYSDHLPLVLRLNLPTEWD